jgi:hypothetical protein
MFGKKRVKLFDGGGELMRMCSVCCCCERVGVEEEKQRI